MADVFQEFGAIQRQDGPFSGANRPKTRNDLIERLMKYDWGRQLNILSYMRRFKTWDALYADLDRIAAENAVPKRYVGIDVASEIDYTVAYVTRDGENFTELGRLPREPKMRNVTPKPKQIKE